MQINKYFRVATLTRILYFSSNEENSANKKTYQARRGDIQGREALLDYNLGFSSHLLLLWFTYLCFLSWVFLFLERIESTAAAALLIFSWLRWRQPNQTFPWRKRNLLLNRRKKRRKTTTMTISGTFFVFKSEPNWIKEWLGWSWSCIYTVYRPTYLVVGSHAKLLRWKYGHATQRNLSPPRVRSSWI